MKIQLLSSHQEIVAFKPGEVEEIFVGKPTDPDIITVVLKSGKTVYCDQVEFREDQISIDPKIDQAGYETCPYSVADIEDGKVNDPADEIWHEAFVKGANFYRESLWHGPDDVPEEYRNFIYHSNDGWIETDSVYDNKPYSDLEYLDIAEWAYVDDILV